MISTYNILDLTVLANSYYEYSPFSLQMYHCESKHLNLLGVLLTGNIEPSFPLTVFKKKLHLASSPRTLFNKRMMSSRFLLGAVEWPKDALLTIQGCGFNSEDSGWHANQ